MVVMVVRLWMGRLSDWGRRGGEGRGGSDEHYLRRRGRGLALLYQRQDQGQDERDQLEDFSGN